MVVRETSRPYLEMLCTALATLDGLDASAALEAFAAFLRVRISAGPAITAGVGGSAVGILELSDSAVRFVTEDPEGGRRGQALLAACLSLVFDKVSTSRVNDPSRNMFRATAGVVHEGEVTMAAEAKQRSASASEILQFAARCRAAGVSKAVFAAMDPSQGPLDVDGLRRLAWQEHGVHLSVVEGVENLLGSVLGLVFQTYRRGAA